MKKVLSILAIASFTFLAQGQAQAQYGLGKGGGGYSGGGVGYGAINSKLTADKNITIFRLLGGFKRDENISFEFGLVFTGSVDGKTYCNTAHYQTCKEHKYNYLGIDTVILFRPTFESGLNNLFVTVGPTFYTRHITASVTQDFRSAGPLELLPEESSKFGVGTLIGVGYDFNLKNGLDLRATVMRFNNSGGTPDGNTTNFGVFLINRN